jgi:ribonuclease Y
MDILAAFGPTEFAISGVGVVIGIGVTFLLQRLVFKAKLASQEKELQVKIDSANREADNILKAAQLDAAGEMIKKKEKFTAEMTQSQNQLRNQENRLSKREDVLDREATEIRDREKQYKNKEQELVRKNKNIETKGKELTTVIAQQKNQLLKITSMNVENAKEMLLDRLEDECGREMDQVITRKVEEAKEIVEEKSREIITTAIQRYAAEQTCEVCVSMVDIPNDEMTGGVIGRDGRNIRAF